MVHNFLLGCVEDVVPAVIPSVTKHKVQHQPVIWCGRSADSSHHLLLHLEIIFTILSFVADLCF